MQIALVHNHYSPEHLETVVSEMRELGAPVIKAVWMECWGVWAALEGCHRIRAAAQLGLTPEIEEIEYDSDYVTDDGYSAEEIADEANTKTIIRFED